MPTAGTGVKRTRVTRPSGVPLDDLVVGGLPDPALGGQVAEEHRVELQHDVRGERHVLVRLVDELQGVAVAGDLLLGAVAGRGRLQDDGLDPPRRGDDALDAVRGLARLDDGGLAQDLELLGDLGDEEVLPAARLTELLDRRELGGVEDERGEVLRGQRAHEWGNGADKWGNKST